MVLPVIGIVGSDSKLQLYIECFLFNGFEIKWIYDRDRTKYSLEMANKYKIKLIDENFAVLVFTEDVELFFVIGSPSNYCYYTKQLSNQAKHVIYTNSLATDLNDCHEILSMYQKSSKLFVNIMNPLKYTPLFQSLKNYVDSNYIGKVKKK